MRTARPMRATRPLISIFGWLLIGGCDGKAEKPSGGTAGLTALRVSAIPDEAPNELIRKFAPLGQYLEKEIGLPVQFTPVTDYAATVEGLANDKLDLVWYGGFTVVQ